MTEHALEWPGMLRAALPVTAAVAGGVAGALGAEWRGALVRPMVSFAAGALVAVVLLHLLPESVAELGWSALLPVLLGGAAAAFLTRRSGAACPACHHGEHPTIASSLSTPMLLMLALHSALDGAVLAGTGGGHHASEVGSLAVLIHKLPEGLVIAALSRASGHSLHRAVLLTLAIQAFTFLGFGGTLALGHIAAPVLSVAMAAVAGSFVYLAALTLTQPGLPRLRHSSIALAGAGLVLVARLALG